MHFSDLQNNTTSPCLQASIREAVSFKGIGVFSGKKSRITLFPEGENSGIVFRKNGSPRNYCKAKASNVVATNRTTTLQQSGNTFVMVEHLLSALSGMGISNCTIEIDGDEVPMLDGSAKEYVEAIHSGLKQEQSPKNVYIVERPLYVQRGDSYIAILPAKDSSISYSLSYPGHQVLDLQHFSMRLDQSIYKKEVASARTFILEKEYASLVRSGALKSEQLDAGVVVGDCGPIAGSLFRYDTEPARHKVLDLIGDLSLAPPFQGHVIASKSGHSLNVAMARVLEDLIQGKRGSKSLPFECNKSLSFKRSENKRMNIRAS